jgi:D-glycero-alpha-D-manno-heptose 1-phosphate guanylyltransferase
MRAILLAGGMGTRLRTVVQDTPKPMARVAGRPFLSHLLDYLERQGIAEVIVSVGYLRQQIIDAYGDQHGGISIRYAIEKEPLGTGGGLRNALGLVDEFPVFALNADTLVDIDYRKMLLAHEQEKVDLTIALRRLADTGRYGRAVVENGRVVAFEAHGPGHAGLINAGVYLFSKNILQTGQAPAFSFERDFLEPQVQTLRPLAFEAEGYFIDIGVPEDYLRAQTELAPSRARISAANLYSG